MGSTHTIQVQEGIPTPVLESFTRANRRAPGGRSVLASDVFCYMLDDSHPTIRDAHPAGCAKYFMPRAARS